MTALELDKSIDNADAGLLTAQQMIALIRELAVYRQMALRLSESIKKLSREVERVSSRRQV